VVSPAKLAHLVIQSHDPGGLAKWYADLLGAKIVFESPVINLLTYDEEHHRIGFAALPPDEGAMTHRVAGAPGMSHVAFGYESIRDLLECYQAAIDRGQKPVVALHHGMTMSFYWKDPDGNNIETFVECLPDARAAMDYMESPAFVGNPVGQPLDGEALISRMRAGATDEELLYYDPAVEVDVMGLAEQTMRSLG
jgi:catechol 2,3-dioxygenase-like lactoylglutathione lyase family enzyme